MTTQTWIDWCQKQLCDLSRRLLVQGYDPARIEYLSHTFPEFRSRFQGFSAAIHHIMIEMAANPDGYHHFEAFTKAKRDLLLFTSLHRELYLELSIADIA